MKTLYKIAFVITIIFLSACDDIIDVELPIGEPVLVVDAWLNDKPEDQFILLTTTIPYFDDSLQPEVSGAVITVSDSEGNNYDFIEQQDGRYRWSPSVLQPKLGNVGSTFQLSIDVNGNQYSSSTYMGGVPKIDSISLTFEKGNSFFDDYYLAEFWADDLIGEGDAYWIKTNKNGVAINKPSEISLAFDAGYSEGSNVDGITFIQPIRQSINPFEEDEEGRFLSPYVPGDTVYVEIHSVSIDAFSFLNELIITTNRPGGFGELFAQPLSNLPTNISNNNATIENDVVGFFNVASVSGLGQRFQ
ncbi:MAG: DUF4249 domain-containing protein [Cyclobacteriaceae bacterium]|nr:DUF4249 domain-containing protein [Cyclobacteriaceae bacterium]